MNSTAKIIIASIAVGILALMGAALFLKQEEQVTLPVKFEEFTDFQCPACALYHPLINQLKNEYSTDNVSFDFLNFPLLSIHPNVYTAHLAAEAAANQGKFAEYSDILFENQDKQTREDLISYAEELGMDVTQFTADLDSSETKAKVDADIALGNSRNINATPTFYINGKRVIFKSTDNPEVVLRQLLDEKIRLGLEQQGQ